MRVTLIVAAIGLIVAALLHAAYTTVSSVIQRTRDAYAVDWTSEFILQHLESNQNQWPTSWEDLRDEYEIREESFYPFTFDQLRQQVWVDWDFDPQTVATMSEKDRSSFKVMRLENGSDAHFVGDEPNEKILLYLQQLESPVTEPELVNE